jgi:hypothetical protein
VTSIAALLVRRVGRRISVQTSLARRIQVHTLRQSNDRPLLRLGMLYEPTCVGAGNKIHSLEHVDPPGSETILDAGRGRGDCMHAILEFQYIVAFEVASHCPAKLILVAEHSKNTITPLARRTPYVCSAISRTLPAETGCAVVNMA